MKIGDFRKLRLPDSPGVYFFKKDTEILYIGKATSLRERVKSYFGLDLIETRGPFLVDMVTKAETISFQKTDSVLEALLLEGELIKKNQPYYNTKEKDDKSFNCVVITKEDFPRVLVIRKKDLDSFSLTVNGYKLQAIFGPFPHGLELREAMRIIRKIFPFRDKCVPLSELSEKEKYQARPCFNAEIGLCPGVCSGTITKEQYSRTIFHLKLFFQGKKKILLRHLQKEMKEYAKNKQFEQAGFVKKTVNALNHIQDVALLKRRGEQEILGKEKIRIEAYDIAHLGGKNMVGVMVVVEDGQIKKSEYRKFKIQGFTNANDTGALLETLSRRFNHLEWPFPQVVVFDGGVAQENVVTDFFQKKIGENMIVKIVGVVKDERHQPRDILGDQKTAKDERDAILLANSEAHRFAIKYHRSLQRSRFV